MPSERKPIVRRLQLHSHTLSSATDVRELGDGCTHGRTVGTISVTAGYTGIGTANAYRVATAVVRAIHPELVVVVGVAGGIDRSLTIGSVVTPNVCTNHATGTTWSPAPWPDVDPVGLLLTTDEFITDPLELRALSSEGFVAVDMETSAIAQACTEAAVPWLAFRGISDDVFDPTVNAQVAGLTKPDGTPPPGARCGLPSQRSSSGRAPSAFGPRPRRRSPRRVRRRACCRLRHSVPHAISSATGDLISRIANSVERRGQPTGGRVVGAVPSST